MYKPIYFLLSISLILHTSFAQKRPLNFSKTTEYALIKKRVNKNRIDLVAQAIFAKQKSMGANSDWSKKLYKKVKQLSRQTQNCTLKFLQQHGLDQDDLDALALEYVRLKKIPI